MELIATIHQMNRTRVTKEQIRVLCVELFKQQRHVTLDEFHTALRSRHGAIGRAATVHSIWREVGDSAQSLPNLPQATGDALTVTLDLKQRLDLAIARAKAAETQLAEYRAREEKIEDRWAARYAEKLAELEARFAQEMALPPTVRAEEYLRMKDRLTALEGRLAQYGANDEGVYE